ncbi:SNARE protein, putative [Plasmodium sp. gorilla clade G2]|uniref:SNARE protein, putative n=1 Tax=Plasmodium sp. gorilla clade G2 TaxID=880535 RepID=UPI000D20BCE4|nr:SNARE protein, putative [Plasmodium sp. gorilla clade G2]SOV17684.1 SNARE protein, putative [Plasmodium sp. gorilla clade G2]
MEEQNFYNKSTYLKRNKISEIEKKCEESLNEILRSANEAKEISKKAEEELQCQTEQIKHINNETDSIKENLKQTEYHLQGIKYWWKNIHSFLGLDSFNNNEDNKTKKAAINNAKFNTKNNFNDNYKKNNENYKNSLNTKPSSQRKGTFDEKYENDLNTLSSMLDELHTRALVMGNTINEQNKMLNNVNEKMGHNIDKIRDQQKMMKEIMKK